jgi:copper chaperone CopZ
MTEITYTVTGMTCGHCAAAVTEEVSAVPGVEAVEVSVEAGTVVVRGAGVSEERVRAAVDEAGYAVV